MNSRCTCKMYCLYKQYACIHVPEVDFISCIFTTFWLIVYSILTIHCTALCVALLLSVIEFVLVYLLIFLNYLIYHESGFASLYLI